MLDIPTIGIGAGSACDGQVLVVHDMLGLTRDFHPRFIRRYANMFDDMTQAISTYVQDVKSGDFPSDTEQYN